MASKRNTTSRIGSMLIALLLMLTFAGCTQNNGDIGAWFGAWTLNSIEADGETDTDYTPNSVTWKFQSTVISMIQLYDYHQTTTSFGTWKRLSDSQLELNFGHSDGELENNSEMYIPAKSTHLPTGISVLNIVKFTDKHLTLTYTANTGITYTYTLSK
jgi:hypothetical protein